MSLGIGIKYIYIVFLTCTLINLITDILWNSNLKKIFAEDTANDSLTRQCVLVGREVMIRYVG